MYGLGYPVFAGRAEYGAGLGDVLKGLWRFFRPVAAAGAKSLLQASSQAMNEGASVKEILKASLKPTMGAVLGATTDQVLSRLNEDKPLSAPPPGPPDTVVVPPQSGSGS